MFRKLLIYWAFFFVLSTANGQFATFNFDGMGTNPTLSAMSDGINCTSGDYYGIFNGSEPDVNITYGGSNGNYLTGQDMDGSGCLPTGGASQTATFSNINISGQTDIVMCFDIAGNGAPGWDSTSELLFTTNIDGTGEQNLIAIQTNNSNSNQAASLDTNCDGVGEGTAAISNTFTTYCVTIPGMGTSLDLVISVNGLNAGSEDFGIDNIEFYSEPNPIATNLPSAVDAFISCSAPSCSVSSGDLILTEIMFNPSGSEPAAEWIEICNTTTSPIDMNGLSILDNTTTYDITTSLIVPVGACVVLSRGTNMVCGTIASDLELGFSLSNAGQSVGIACGATIVDEVDYDLAGFPPSVNGSSIQLNLNTYDSVSNDDGANWCLSNSSCGGGDSGSPGSDNSAFELTFIEPSGCIEANMNFDLMVCFQCDGDNITSYTDNITLNIGGVDQTVAAINGCATFTLNQAAGTYAISATDGTNSATPIEIDISPVCTVYITEIAADNGSGDGLGSSEWIELYNPTDMPIDMSCYVLVDGDWAITFPPGTMIGPMSYFTIGLDAFASCPNCDNADGDTDVGIAYADLVPNPANTVPIAGGTEYDLDVEQLNDLGYYNGFSVTSTCPDGTETTYPNFVINSTGGEQLALFDGTGGTTDPVFALNWNGGQFNGGNGNATAVSPTADACATNGVNYAFPTDTTDPFYDDDMPNISREIACSSSWAYVNGEWIIDDTPTPGQDNDISAYSLTIDGRVFDLGPIYDVNAPLQGDFGEKIFICGPGMLTVDFSFLNNYQNLWVDELINGIPVWQSPGPFTSGGGRGSYIDIDINGTTTANSLSAAPLSTGALVNGDMGYIELQIREQAYGSTNFNLATCSPDNELAPMSSDCIMRIQVPFEVVIPPMFVSVSPSVCIGAEKYTFDVDLSGGTAPFIVNYDGATVGSYMSSPFTVGTLTADNAMHTIEIIDANGCMTTTTVMAPDPATCTNTCTDEVGTTALTYTYCTDAAPATINLEVSNSILNGPPPQIAWAVSSSPISNSSQITAGTFVGSGSPFNAAAPSSAGTYYYTPYLSSTDPATEAIDPDCQDYGNPIIVLVAEPLNIVSANTNCSVSGENYTVEILVSGGLPTIDGTASYAISSSVNGVTAALTATNTYTVGTFPIGTNWDITLSDGSCTVAMDGGTPPNCCPSALANAAFTETAAFCNTGTVDLDAFGELDLVNQYPANAVLNWTSTQTVGSPVIDMTDLALVSVSHSGTGCEPEVATFTLEIDCTTDTNLNLAAGTFTLTVFPSLDATDVVINATACSAVVMPSPACADLLNITYDADGTGNYTDASSSSMTSGETVYYQITYAPTNAPSDCFFRGSFVLSNCCPDIMATLSGAGTICSANPIAVDLILTITGGSGTYDIVYTDGTSDFTLENQVVDGSNEINLSLNPTVTSTYTLVSVVDDGATPSAGCMGTVSGNATILVNNVSCNSFPWNGN